MDLFDEKLRWEIIRFKNKKKCHEICITSADCTVIGTILAELCQCVP